MEQLSIDRTQINEFGEWPTDDIVRRERGSTKTKRRVFVSPRSLYEVAGYSLKLRTMEAPLLVLFLNAFIAATILPASSEIVLAVIIADGAHGLWPPIAVATIGNTAGAVVNWILGRFLSRYVDRKWFPLNPRQYERASRWFGRFGIWSLLFAWLPIVGDPLTVVAGLLRVRFWPFLVLVAIGKGARYVAIAVTLASVF